MYYISDSHALLLLCYGNLIVPWFIHSFIPSIHLMLNGQRSLIYDNILLLCPRFLCMIVWYGIRYDMGIWSKPVKILHILPRQSLFSDHIKLSWHFLNIAVDIRFNIIWFPWIVINILGGTFDFSCRRKLKYRLTMFTQNFEYITVPTREHFLTEH